MIFKETTNNSKYLEQTLEGLYHMYRLSYYIDTGSESVGHILLYIFMPSTSFVLWKWCVCDEDADRSMFLSPTQTWHMSTIVEFIFLFPRDM